VTTNFYRKTLPLYAQEFLNIDGKVWLPNVRDVEAQVINESQVLKYFSIKYVQDPMENPLYRCTEDVTDELLKCPDKLVNENQTPTNAQPFILLERREHSLSDEVLREVIRSSLKRKSIDSSSCFKNQRKKNKHN